MTKAQVRREAGKPLEDAAHPKRGKSRKRGADDIWTYRGSDGVYQLTFLRGKVYRIDVTPDREF